MATESKTSHGHVTTSAVEQRDSADEHINNMLMWFRSLKIVVMLVF